MSPYLILIFFAYFCIASGMNFSLDSVSVFLFQRVEIIVSKKTNKKLGLRLSLIC